MVEARYEVQVDTDIAAAYYEAGRRQTEVGNALDALHYLARDTKRGRVWEHTTREVVAIATAARDNPATVPFQQDNAKAALAAYEEAQEALLVAEAVYEEQAKRYEGWTRFFIVPGGHIHSSMACSTCYTTTRFSWLPALSGLTEADAVAEHGALLCTVCYPSAPVEWTKGIERPAGCAGGGKVADGDWRMRYARCPVCGQSVARTSTGLLRKHKEQK